MFCLLQIISPLDYAGRHSDFAFSPTRNTDIETEEGLECRKKAKFPNIENIFQYEGEHRAVVSGRIMVKARRKINMTDRNESG